MKFHSLIYMPSIGLRCVGIYLTPLKNRVKDNIDISEMHKYHLITEFRYLTLMIFILI